MIISNYPNKLVRTRVELTMVSTIKIQRGDIGDLDPVTLQVGGIKNPTTVYQGKARIHPLVGNGAIALGEGQIEMRSTTITIPISATVPHRDDLVTDLTDDDVDLPNRTFRVTDVEVGGFFNAYRTLTCTSWADDRWWP